MSIRSDLLTQLTTNLNGTNVSVSSEMPYIEGGETLFEANMKTLYVDEEQISQETLYETLDSQNINVNISTLNAYLVVDAKNQLSDIATVISNVLSAKSAITNTISRESDYETEIANDELTYTFEFRFEKTVN